MKTRIDTKSIASRGAVALLAACALLATVACSDNSKPKISQSQSSGPTARPVAVEGTIHAASQPAKVVVATKNVSVAKPPASKVMLYKSRDYGVSFSYPWQYSLFNAKAINADAALEPKSDGSEGQFTLARVEIPKGFYPDTNFETGYLTVSLNQDLGEDECKSVLDSDAGSAKAETINDVEFKWSEIESGGSGSAEKVRSYVTFANGTCYEFELGVRTKNDHGLAREVNPDQVFHRLDAMLKTVKIQAGGETKVAQQQEQAEEPTPDSGK